MHLAGGEHSWNAAEAENAQQQVIDECLERWYNTHVGLSASTFDPDR